MSSREKALYLLLPLAVISMIVFYISQQSSFSGTAAFEEFGISFRVPGDFQLSTGSYQQGVLYGHDKGGNYYRVMWEPYGNPAGLSEQEILEDFARQEADGERMILPIQNAAIRKENGAYKQLSTQTLWPWISGVKYQLLEYQKEFEGTDGRTIVDWTVIWHCTETKRLILASLESGDGSFLNYNQGFFVAYIDCAYEGKK
jgi:hypothetical protein